MQITSNIEQQGKATAAIIEWLHQAWTQHESGQLVEPDPFYARNALLTPSIVAAVVGEIEGLHQSELEKYPGYHRNAQGASADEYLAPPGYSEWAYEEQFALVQGIDRIMQPYRLEVRAIPEGEAGAP